MTCQLPQVQVQKIRLLFRQQGLGAIRVGTVDDYQGQVMASTLEKGPSCCLIGPCLHCPFVCRPIRLAVALPCIEPGPVGPIWPSGCCAGGAHHLHLYGAFAARDATARVCSQVAITAGATAAALRPGGLASRVLAEPKAL